MKKPKRKHIVAVSLFLVLALAAVAIHFVKQREGRVFLLIYKSEPFRRDVQLTFVKTLASFDEFDAPDVKTVEFTPESTTDNVNWSDYRSARVVVCTLIPGRNALPSGLPLVLGPLRSANRDFALRNNNALFLLSDICDLPVANILSTQLAIPAEKIFYAAAGAAGLADNPFGMLMGLPENSYLGNALSAIDNMSSGSLLFVACDGVSNGEMELLTTLAAKKGIAVGVDRPGYMNCGAFAQLSVDSETVGDSLARLALKMASGAAILGEIREVASIIKLYSVSAADRLGIVPQQDGFQPVR